MTTVTSSTTSPTLDLVQYQKDLASATSTSTGSTTSTSASSSSGSSTLDKDDFMNLLVTQLQYQDPLDPQDNSQMAAQMAQFASLESMQNIEEAIGTLSDTVTAMTEEQTDAANSLTNSSATGLIGKSVRFKQTDVDVPTSGSTTSLNVHATSGSVAVIADEDGNTVRTIALDGVNDDGTDILDDDGDGTIEWDGTDDTGTRVSSGSYTVSVVDEATLEETGYAYAVASVSSITFDDDGPLLTAGTQSFRMSELLEINESDSTTDTGAATTAAMAMVGKTARFRDASAELSSSEDASWTFTAASGSIGQILDSSGNVVKTFSVDSDGNLDTEENTGSYTWDGTESSGDVADSGTYYLRIVDATATKTTGTAYVEGTIDKVAFDLSGNPCLAIGDNVWTMSDLFTLT